MLRWTLAFLILALVAAGLGFSGVAVASASVARILFYVFLLCFLVALTLRLLDTRAPPI